MKTSHRAVSASWVLRGFGVARPAGGGEWAIRGGMAIAIIIFS